MALHRLTAEMNEEQVGWSLAVALTAMSDAALQERTMQRSRNVVEHLASVAANEAVTLQLRTACDKLIAFWEDARLQ